MRKLPQNFYGRDTIKVAKNLLGKYIVRIIKTGKMIGKIVETEAYLGEKDPASHAYKGRYTERTKVLYGPPGRAYVYKIYGMYHCFNVVAHPKSEAGGVFIRALEPIEGIKIMRRRRAKNVNPIRSSAVTAPLSRKKYFTSDIKTSNGVKNLTNGPSKLCIAMDIDKRLNGESLHGNKLYIIEGEKVGYPQIANTIRINIDYAGKAKNWLLRFVIKENKFVSRRELPRI